MQTEAIEDERNQWCFGCGTLNPIGLHLVFREEDEVYITEFTAGREHQGYDGIVHGGIISTLLDEVMARYVHSLGVTAVTARLEVRYQQPIPIRTPLIIRGWKTAVKGKLYQMAGSVSLPDGSIAAEGKGTIMVTQQDEV